MRVGGREGGGEREAGESKRERLILLNVYFNRESTLRPRVSFPGEPWYTIHIEIQLKLHMHKYMLKYTKNTQKHNQKQQLHFSAKLRNTLNCLSSTRTSNLNEICKLFKQWGALKRKADLPLWVET